MATIKKAQNGKELLSPLKGAAFKLRQIEDKKSYSKLNQLELATKGNLNLSQFIQKKFGLTDDQVFNNIQKYGNTTAASVPIALTEAWEQGKIKSGDVVILAAFGSGFTWGSVIIKW